MRTIKHPIYLLALLVLSLFSSCTKYDFVETGKATSYHDTTMWEYFQTDSYNWSYLVYMTKRAGLEDLFQGTNTQYGPNITFLGITNHSIRRYLYRTYGINEDGTSPADAVDPSTLTDEETMKLIDRMSVATCRSIIPTVSSHRRSSSSRTSPQGVRPPTGAPSVRGVRPTRWPRASNSGSTPSATPTQG